jgi:hypothetical protein
MALGIVWATLVPTLFLCRESVQSCVLSDSRASELEAPKFVANHRASESAKHTIAHATVQAILISTIYPSVEICRGFLC